MSQGAATEQPSTPVPPTESLELEGTAVALLESPVPPTEIPEVEILTPPAAAADEGSGFAARDLIPVVLAFQIVLIGAAGFWYFRRGR
jgi:hypothetical protein